MPNFSSLFVREKSLLLFGGVFLLGLLDLFLRNILIPGGGLCNPGIAWGIVLPESALLVGSTLILFVFVLLFARERERGRKFAWLLILTGGFINFQDRLLFGCVRDYVSLPFFPSFNLADMMLTLGVGVIVFLLFFRQPE